MKHLLITTDRVAAMSLTVGLHAHWRKRVTGEGPNVVLQYLAIVDDESDGFRELLKWRSWRGLDLRRLRDQTATDPIAVVNSGAYDFPVMRFAAAA